MMQLLYNEPYRPAIHFTPARYWMNDPNGLFFLNGVYHLFYQHNPHDRVWSTMSWGHATSTDLINWTHRPLALEGSGDGLGYCFSGCAVVDRENTSGLGTSETPPIVLLFTQHSLLEKQVQSVAYSTDEGYSWKRYSGNPVLDEVFLKDFRDPKVIWMEERGRWIMLLAAGKQIRFYESENLLRWRYLSSFGDQGSLEGTWECPDLLRFSDQVVPDRDYWILIVSVDAGGPNGGSATQYFIGSFDGYQFEASDEELRWLDYGPDNYAGVSWSNLPSGHPPVWAAWMNNWRYAARLPTKPWRGSLSIPRALEFHSGAPEEPPSLRHRPWPGYDNLSTRGQTLGSLELSPGRQELSCIGALALDVQLQLEGLAADELVILDIGFVHGGGEVLLSFNFVSGLLSLDRSSASDGVEDPAFTQPISMPLAGSVSGSFEYRFVYDQGSLEVFQLSGGASLTALLFSESSLSSIFFSLEASGPKGVASVTSLPASEFHTVDHMAEIHNVDCSD